MKARFTALVLLLGAAPLLAAPTARPVAEPLTDEKLKLARQITKDWDLFTLVSLSPAEMVPRKSAISWPTYARAWRKAIRDNQSAIDAANEKISELRARYQAREELMVEARYEESSLGRSLHHKKMKEQMECLTGRCGYYPTTPGEDAARDKSNIWQRTPDSEARTLKMSALIGVIAGPVAGRIVTDTVRAYMQAGGKNFTELVPNLWQSYCRKGGNDCAKPMADIIRAYCRAGGTDCAKLMVQNPAPMKDIILH